MKLLQANDNNSSTSKLSSLNSEPHDYQMETDQQITNKGM
jgi:hypothetical protein